MKAGIDGVLQSIAVEVGQHVTPGTNLARVADPKKLKAEIKINETLAKDIAVGQAATVDTRNGVVAGSVARVDPSVRNGTVEVEIELPLALPKGSRPDLAVTATIELESLNNVLYVGRPVRAEPDSTISVFKVLPDGDSAQRTPVTVGFASMDNIEIKKGLTAGDKIILSDVSAWNGFDRIRLK